MKKSVFGFSVHDMAEIALLCSIAILLDQFVNIGVGSTGGSINISMFPLFLISLRHGPFKGFIAGGVVFGLISCLLDGYGINTYPLEYFVPFGCVGLLGFFSKYIYKNLAKDKVKESVFCYLIVIVCLVVCALVRMLCASLDSMMFYGYDFVSAVLYHLAYVPQSALGVLVIVCILLPYIKMINRLYKPSYLVDNN